jgi:hypothetical protein
VRVLVARRWPTPLTREQFAKVTGATSFPDFLRQDVAKDVAGDTDYSVMRGTRAHLVIRQGAEQGYKPTLYVDKVANVAANETEAALRAALARLQSAYSGVGIQATTTGWSITVPSRYDVGHEAHFAQVTEGFLAALRDGGLPAWEVPNTLTKYSTLAQAYEMSHSPDSTHGNWQRTSDSLAWLSGGKIVWKLSLDPKAGHKPHFHPLSVAGGPVLTQARPEDHPWHYGLWLSWKYINGVNYWEEDRKTDKPDGVTSWKLASLDTRADGSATIHLDVTYTHPSGRVDLTEQRAYEISAPAADGSYRIDWRSKFRAGAEGALLERTPMPGESKGQVNGGYAGLGLRMAPEPLRLSFISNTGETAQFKDNRWRPNAVAVAANFADTSGHAGGIAVLAHTPSPWYVVNAPDQQMRFLCAAVLAPKPLKLAPGEALELRHTIALRRTAWTAEALRALAASHPST